MRVFWCVLALVVVGLAGCADPTGPDVHCFGQGKSLNASSGDTAVNVKCPNDSNNG